MSIMEQMRSGSDSTFMQVVVALVVVSFIGWYATPSGDKSSLVATVNGVKIMDTEYNRTYRNERNTAERRAGRTLSDPEAKQLSEQVKQQLIEDEVVLQEARRIGLEVSDTEVARQLLNLPGLKDETGKFDEDLYLRFLKRQQFTRADFEERMRRDMLRRKLRSLVYMGASISEPALREAFVESNTRIDLKTVRVRASAFSDDVQITDEDRAAWLVENEELVKETYERDFDRLYNHPEKVRLSMIRMAVASDGVSVGDLLPRIRSVRERLVAGGDFAEEARRWSEDPSALDGGDLGLRPVPQLTTDSIAAIEDLEIGGISRVVTSDSDVRLYRLEERVEPRVDAYDDMKNEIAERAMRDEQVPGLAAAFAEEQLLPAWKASGEVPEELLEQKGLTASSTGPIPAVADGSPFGPPPGMLNDARVAEPGQVLDEVYEHNGTLWVGQLTERVDADMELFAAQSEQFREDVLLQRRQAFYTGWVSDAKARARIQ